MSGVHCRIGFCALASGGLLGNSLCCVGHARRFALSSRPGSIAWLGRPGVRMAERGPLKPLGFLVDGLRCWLRVRTADSGRSAIWPGSPGASSPRWRGAAPPHRTRGRGQRDEAQGPPRCLGRTVRTWARSRAQGLRELRQVLGSRREQLRRRMSAVARPVKPLVCMRSSTAGRQLRRAAGMACAGVNFRKTAACSAGQACAGRHGPPAGGLSR